ncbi:4'-phosphopantetheinyl transferase family protein [Bacillus thuringiensis]|uniref:4'-phosphopantetheinyl transferase family protein n=1 Tax=Bacillus thuringiensis TaxID=1428 RepID=UPI003A897DFF
MSNNLLIYYVVIPENLKKDSLDFLTKFLDEIEYKKYKKCVPKRQIEYLVGRILIKIVLAQLLNKTAQEIKIEIGTYGKPYVETKEKVNFNLSHSQSVVTAAFSMDGVIGIDVEYLNSEYLEVMPEVFSKGELTWVNSMDNKQLKLEEFYKIWTRKEALSKAKGKGLYISPQNIKVPFKQENYRNGWWYYTKFLNENYIISVVSNVFDRSKKYEIREMDFKDLLNYDTVKK